MEPTPELIDELYRDKVRRARAESPQQKLFTGIDLFDMACEFMRSGIRMQHPEFDEAQVEDTVRYRLALGRRLETWP